jgi:lysophospholipase L1-like esterase
MSMIRPLLRAAGAFALAGVALSCDHEADVLIPEPADDIFRSYVAIGNSITAGFQSDGINDATQRQSYAFLLAQQMRTRFAYPSLTMPGCQPPIINWQMGTRLNTPTPVIPGGCQLRNPALATDVLNNVAVPGAASTEVNTPGATVPPAPPPFHNTLTSLILGGKTQVERALEANPTFLTVWIGNNDVLQAAATGITTPTPNVSRGITPVAAFTSNYGAMITALAAGAPDAQGVLMGTVKTTAAPLLFPVTAFQNAAFANGFNTIAGGAVTIHPNCTGSGALVSFLIAGQMRSGAHPRVIVCQKNTPGFPAPVGDIFIVDAQDLADIDGAVDQYNAFIQTKATELGWVYVNPNDLVTALRDAGCINLVPNLGAAPTASPFGACVSLDGIHPSATGQAHIANALIGAINAAYETSLPTVTVP